MHLMSLSEIMDNSIDILRKHVKSIALFTVGYGIVAFLLILAVVIVGGIIAALVSGLLESIVFAIIFFSIIGILAAALVLSLYSGTIKITSQEYVEGPVFAHDAIKASFKNIFKVFGIISCAVIMFIPIGGPIGWLGYKAIKSFNYASMLFDTLSGSTAFAIIIPIVLVLVATFIIMAYITWFSFSLHAAVVEKKGVIASIIRSFKLVRKNYWKIFGSALLFNLTVYAIRVSIDALIGLGSSLIYLVFKIFSISQDYTTFLTSIYSYLRWPMNLIFWMVITPIAAIMLTLLYFNQRFNKEGFDIMLRLQEIQKNDERKQLSEAVEFNNSL